MAMQAPVEPTLKPELHWLHLWALLQFLQWALPVLHLKACEPMFML